MMFNDRGDAEVKPHRARATSACARSLAWCRWWCSSSGSACIPTRSSTFLHVPVQEILDRVPPALAEHVHSLARHRSTSPRGCSRWLADNTSRCRSCRASSWPVPPCWSSARRPRSRRSKARAGRGSRPPALWPPRPWPLGQWVTSLRRRHAPSDRRTPRSASPAWSRMDKYALFCIVLFAAVGVLTIMLSDAYLARVTPRAASSTPCCCSSSPAWSAWPWPPT